MFKNPQKECFLKFFFCIYWSKRWGLSWTTPSRNIRCWRTSRRNFRKTKTGIREKRERVLAETRGESVLRLRIFSPDDFVCSATDDPAEAAPYSFVTWTLFVIRIAFSIIKMRKFNDFCDSCRKKKRTKSVGQSPLSSPIRRGERIGNLANPQILCRFLIFSRNDFSAGRRCILFRRMGVSHWSECH